MFQVDVLNKQTKFVCQFFIRWFDEEGAIFKENGWNDSFAVVLLSKEGFGFFILVDIDPREWNILFVQESFGTAAIAAPVCAIDDDVGLGHVSSDDEALMSVIP